MSLRLASHALGGTLCLLILGSACSGDSAPGTSGGSGGAGASLGTGGSSGTGQGTGASTASDTGGSTSGVGGSSSTGGSGIIPAGGNACTGEAGVPSGAVVFEVDNTSVRTLPDHFHGFNYVAFWDEHQGSEASARALGRTGLNLVRFPGGWPAVNYLWFNPYHEVNEYTKSTTSPEQLWDWAKKLTTDPLILFQTNNTTYSGNDPSAAAITKIVSDAKSRGMKMLWEIGNEPDDDISWYIPTFNTQAQAIHAACDDCVVMGPAIFTQAWGMNRLEDFLAGAGHNADAISIHYYGGDGWGGEADLNAAQDWLSQYQYLTGLTNKPIYVTEWSIVHNPDWYHMSGKVLGALNNADVLGAFCRTPNVAGHTFFGSMHNIWNNWGILSDGGYGDHVVIAESLGSTDNAVDLNAAMLPMLHLWTSVMGNEVIQLSHPANPQQVNGWAHRRADGSVQVMLINKMGGSEQPVRVQFSGFDPVGKVLAVHELKAKHPSTEWECPAGASENGCWEFVYNGVENVQFRDREPPLPSTFTCEGPAIDRVLPPFSITVLDLIP
jgi:hypothetical protein